MIADYFFNDGAGSGGKRKQTQGSFGFDSSQFSHKENVSNSGERKKMDPSFFNESSIKMQNTSGSGEFIYFENDSVLSELEMELKVQSKNSLKMLAKQKKKKDSINYSKEISFQDSLHPTLQKNDESELKEYGTGKSNLPPTLKKPKFGFKVSQTAESSAIIKDAEPSIVINEVNEEYQLKSSKSVDNNLRICHLKDPSKYLKNKTQQECLKSSRKSIKENAVQKDESSISSIQRPSKQPSLSSKQLSTSNLNNGSMNFRSVFRHKIEKASVINSSLNKNHRHMKSNQSISSNGSINHSLSRTLLGEREIKIAELKDLRELENKLGEIKHQNKKIIEYMIEKDQEIQTLKKKKIEVQAEDPYAIMKENQLMKAFLESKKKKSLRTNNEESPLGSNKYLHSAKSLREMSLKKSSQISSLQDFQIKQHKLKVEPQPLTKMEKKFILSNRGMILSQKYLDVGYSLKDSYLTLYVTLKMQYNEVRIKLQENSFILSQTIDRVFNDLEVGKQLKFKTEIKSTKCSSPEELALPLCLKISLSSEHKFENKLHQFKVNIPVTVYNIAKHMQMQQIVNLTQKSSSRFSGKEVFKTQTFVSCKEMYRDPEGFLVRLFPMGVFLKDENIFEVGFGWKEKRDLLKIRIKERSFVIEGQGDPKKSTFEVVRSIVNLLIEERPEK